MKILFITLSNIGDVILTLPALDALIRDYPQAQISVLCGPRPKEIFENNPFISRLIVYDKRFSFSENLSLFNELNSQKFDIVVDLRNTFFGVFLSAGRRTNPFLRLPRTVKHASLKHLLRLRGLVSDLSSAPRVSLNLSGFNRDYAAKLLKECGVSRGGRFLVVAPGARSSLKRWDKFSFRRFMCALEPGVFERIILVGDADDSDLCLELAQGNANIVSVAGTTTLRALGALLAEAALLVTNDSAILHLASYLNVPVISLFGPTDDRRYGPWASRSVVLRRLLFCAPCNKAQCAYGTVECLKLIKPAHLLEAVKRISGPGDAVDSVSSVGREYERILVCRTDRIGDVVLSTPVLRALRKSFPRAYISVMVQPLTAPLLEDNPDIDDVIVMKKEGFLGSWDLVDKIRRKKFDLALILHTTTRVNLITFLAGIRERLGYARKSSWLLTRKLAYVKARGEKHELDYNLDLLRLIGVDASCRKLFVPLTVPAAERVNALLADAGIGKDDLLVVMHPSASCPSKIWPKERFVELIRLMSKVQGLRLALIAGEDDKSITEWICSQVRFEVLNLAGMLSLQETAALLKRSVLFISNDSGPVHISSAVGTPVISIFGRNQPGLGPGRWGPVGEKDRFIHKPVGCAECLAHDCKNDFACLKAVTAEDVMRAAGEVINRLS